MPIASAVIGAGTSLFGGIMGSNAAKKAANAQADAANKAAGYAVGAGNNALDYQNQATHNEKAIQSPFYNAGVAGLNALTSRMGLNPSLALPGTPMTAAMLSDPTKAAAVASGGYQGGSAGPAQGNPAGWDGNGNFTVGTTAPRASIGPNGVDVNTMPGVVNPVDAQGHFIPPGRQTAAHMWRGGMVHGPGTPTSDSIPVHLSTGEGVLNAKAMSMPGVTEMVMRLNRQAGMTPHIGGRHFDTGGEVTAQPPNFQGGPTGLQTIGQAPSPTPAAGGLTITSNSSGKEGLMPAGQTLDGGPVTAAGGSGAAVGSPAGGDGAELQPFNPLSYGNLLQGYDPQFSAPTASDMTTDPGYQFRLDQGQKALERSAAARGGLLTGGTAKDLLNYGQGLASQEYGNIYNRALQTYGVNQGNFRANQEAIYNRLMGITGVGQNSANTLTNASQMGANNVAGIDMNTANNVGQDLTNAGTARASGYVGSSNALTGGMGGVANAAQLYALMRGGSNPSSVDFGQPYNAGSGSSAVFNPVPVPNPYADPYAGWSYPG